LILDTNALSAFLDRVAEAVTIVSEAHELAIPVIVAGEFAFGIAQSRHRETYERSLQRMLERCTVLAVEIETARHYAAIRMELKTAGKPIPANDLWIAALSRQHAMPLMSRDTHFDLVGGLRRRTWQHPTVP
jgi:tRNA(fMet)-specific endonuclease VapC